MGNQQLGDSMKLCKYCNKVEVAENRTFCSRKCANTYKNKSKEHREKVSLYFKSDKGKEQLERTLKNLWANPDFRKSHSERHSLRMKSLNKDPKFRSKVESCLSESVKRKWATDEIYRERVLTIFKQYRESDENRVRGKECFTLEHKLITTRTYLNNCDIKNNIKYRYFYIVRFQDKIKIGTYMEGNNRRERVQL